MSTLFKGVYYYLAIPLTEHTIQGSTLIKGAYYSRKYGIQMIHKSFTNELKSMIFLMQNLVKIRPHDHLKLQ